MREIPRRSAFRPAAALAGVAAALAFGAPAAPAIAGSGSSGSRPAHLLVAKHVFGKRYCELFLVHKHGTGYLAAVYNTYPLNSCPEPAWNAIDTTAVATANHALAAIRNGPRYWLMNSIVKSREGREVAKNLGGIKMIEEAQLSLPTLSTAPYTIHSVNRATTWIYNAGQTVYELHALGGMTWVMQSWSQQIDPTLSLADLAGLASRLKLPTGWHYTVQHLAKSLKIVTLSTNAEVLQDDLDDTYTKVVAPPRAQAAAASDYDTGLALGTEAYQYGLPLLDADRVYRAATSASRCNGATGEGPANAFCSLSALATPSETAAPAPNNDTLYSSAWLTNLSEQPEVIHAPAIKNRFWEFELLDPWTNDFFNITSIPNALGPGDFGVTGGGNWAIVGPHFRGHVPAGVTVVHAPYDRVWIAGRTFVRGSSDVGNVHAIQNGYTITPLSRFGHGRPNSQGVGHAQQNRTTIPGTQPGENPLAFYAALDRLMRTFPPPKADRPLLAKLAAIGVGPGLKVAKAHLSADTLRGMRDAITQGHAKVLSAFLSLYLKDFTKYHGYVIGDLGDWGTHYLFRAIGDTVGIGGQRSNIALYPVALFDDTKAPLTSSDRYVLHIPKSSLPIPVSAFWSLTLYDSNSYLVPNVLRRYVINDLSHLRKNADGSIDLYIQSTKPTDPAEVSNWLPAPAASGSGFRLIWRLYGLGRALPGVLNGTGWEPPPIQPCDATGHGNEGAACAS